MNKTNLVFPNEEMAVQDGLATERGREHPRMTVGRMSVAAFCSSRAEVLLRAASPERRTVPVAKSDCLPVVRDLASQDDLRSVPLDARADDSDRVAGLGLDALPR